MRREMEKERENEKKGKGEEEMGEGKGKREKREGGRKGKGTSLANANKINQKLLEEPNWGATPFLSQPTSFCPLQLYRLMEAFDFLGPSSGSSPCHCSADTDKSPTCGTLPALHSVSRRAPFRSSFKFLLSLRTPA